MSRRRSQGRRSTARIAAGALVVLAAFVLGVALGAALDEQPAPGTTTYERTLRFATVTVTNP